MKLGERCQAGKLSIILSDPILATFVFIDEVFGRLELLANKLILHN